MLAAVLDVGQRLLQIGRQVPVDPPRIISLNPRIAFSGCGARGDMLARNSDL
jgi:hypothetical protein